MPEGACVSGLFHTQAVASSARMSNRVLLSWSLAPLLEIVEADVSKNASGLDLKVLGEKARKRFREARQQYQHACAAFEDVGGTSQQRTRFYRETLQKRDQGWTFPAGAREQVVLQVDHWDHEREKAAREMAEIARRTAPMVVAKALGPEQILNHRDLGSGGAVCNLDTDGRSLREILHAHGRTRRGVMDVFVRSFDHSVRVKQKQAVPAPSVSELAMIDEALLLELLNDGHVGRSGFLSRCLFVDLDTSATNSMNLEEAWNRCEEFDELLIKLYDQRFRQAATEHVLSPGAVEVLQAFVGEVEAVQSGCPELAAYLSHWHQLVSKLALLIHLGSGGLDIIEIPREAMERASAIFARVGGGGMDLLARLRRDGLEQEAKLESQLEVLVTKVKMKGGATVRELVRSYSRMKVSSLKPLLELAQESGLIREEEGRYLAVG